MPELEHFLPDGYYPDTIDDVKGAVRGFVAEIIGKSPHTLSDHELESAVRTAVSEGIDDVLYGPAHRLGG